MFTLLALLLGNIGGCAFQKQNGSEAEPVVKVETESETEADYEITHGSEAGENEVSGTEVSGTEVSGTEVLETEVLETETLETETLETEALEIEDSEEKNQESKTTTADNSSVKIFDTENGQTSGLPYYAFPTNQTVTIEEPYPGEEQTDSSESSESAETAEAADPEYYSRNVIIIDVGKHEILLQKDPYERINPASMTKMMELLVAAEQLTEEDLDRMITVSQEAINYSYENGCSVAGFEAGDEVTMRDLLYGTILPSGGEASYQLALELAGSMEGFADLMNQKAEELGISATTHFTNSVGLYDENHYSTVYDMAIIMEAVMDTVIGEEVMTTVVYQMGSTIQYPDGYSLHNSFLEKIAEKGLPGKVTAAKTGYISLSKKCAASCYQAPSGKLYVAVTAGAYAETIGGQTTNCILDHVKLYTNYAP